MLNATIAGNIGKDAETRQAGQSTVTSFNVAVEQRGRDGKITTWVRCSMWGKRGDTLCQYLTKGSRVCAAGELTTRDYEGKTYIELNVADLTLMGGKPQSGGHSGEYGSGSSGNYQAPPPSDGMDDSEIPF